MTRARSMTSDEKILSRIRRQRTKLKIAGLENRPAVFSAQINQAFATHNMIAEFDYDGVTVGAYTDVLPGMTAYIGTAEGASDLGVARIRKAPTSNHIYIGETSEIAFADDLWVTVVDEMLIWPRHTKIVDEVILMDYDIAYSDQNLYFDPVPIMGSTRVVDVVDYPVTVEFPRVADSYVKGGAITDYLMTANAGTVNDGATDAPSITIESYPANGLIRVALTVTSDHGKTTTGYRYVHVYDPSHRPFELFYIENCRATKSRGYWSFDVVSPAEVSLSQVRDRAEIIVFAEDWYDSSKTNFGQLEGSENIICIGRIARETLELLPDKDDVARFAVQGAGYWLSRMQGFPPGVTMATNTPANWVQVAGLTVDLAVWHLLHWRCTASVVMDVYLSEDDRYSAGFQVPSQSIWAQINDFAFKSIFAMPAVDRFGRFFCEIDSQLTPVADRDWPEVIAIEKQDYMGKIDIRRRSSPDISVLQLNGVRVDESGSSSAIFSIANGHIPKTFGDPDTLPGLLLDSQSQANELCGLSMALQNLEFEPFEVSFASNNRMFDIAPRMKSSIEIAQADSVRGIEYSGDIVPLEVGFNWDNDGMYLQTDVVFEIVTSPELNTDDYTPSMEDVDFSTPDSSSLSLPLPLIFPDIQPFELPAGVVNVVQPKEVIMGLNGKGLVFADNFDASAADVKWRYMNMGLEADDLRGLTNIVVTPSGAIFITTNDYLNIIGVTGGAAMGRRRIYYANSLGSSWKLYYDAFANQTEDVPEFVTGIAANPKKSEQIVFHTSMRYALVPYGHVTDDFFSNLNIGNRSGYSTTKYAYTHPFSPPGWNSLREYLTGIAFTNGYIVILGSQAGGIGSVPVAKIGRFSSGGTFVDEYPWTWYGAGASRFCQSIGGGDKFFGWSAGPGYDVFNTSGTLWDHNTPALLIPSFSSVQAVAFSPDGLHGMGGDIGHSLGGRFTTDGGLTWAAPASAMVGQDVWENCKDNNRWIFGGGTTIRYTGDIGATYEDKSGNLSYIAPLCDITNIRMIS